MCGGLLVLSFHGRVVRPERAVTGRPVGVAASGEGFVGAGYLARWAPRV